jgi:hypothetical protein
MGSTGPVLAFSTVIFNMSQTIDVPFLTFNAWISAWVFLYCVLAGFFDLTRVIRLATRFTDEIFALLIVSIFVRTPLVTHSRTLVFCTFLPPTISLTQITKGTQTTATSQQAS